MIQSCSKICGSQLSVSGQEKQTNCSFYLRVTLFAIGIIGTIVAALILFDVPGLNQLGTTAGWTMLSVSVVSLLSGLAQKHVQNHCLEFSETSTHSSINSEASNSSEILKNLEEGVKKSLKPSSLNSVVRTSPATLEISEETLSNLKKELPSILKKSNVNATFYDGQKDNLIFSLKCAPHLIFKLCRNDNESIQKRFNDSAKAREICQNYHLDLLKIPLADLIEATLEGKSYKIVVEERMDASSDQEINDKLYETYAEKLNETIRQLTCFICLSGFSDMAPRNAPILVNQLDLKNVTNVPVGLVDFGELGSSIAGLFGIQSKLMPRRGLIGCIQPNQFNIVIDEAKKHLPFNKEFEERMKNAIELRTKELEDQKALAKFYEEAKITKGDEKIKLQGEELGFSGQDEQDADQIIAEINQAIEGHSNKKTIQSKRLVRLYPNNIKDIREHPDALEPEGIFHRVIQKLIEKKQIFSSKFDQEQGVMKRFILQA